MAGESPTPQTERGAIPTNVITYKGRKIPARIDPDARLAHVVEIMANSFSAKEHHITLCLRDEADGLVTQTNLPSKVINHDALKLVASPTTEALAVIHSLKSTSSRRSLENSTASLSGSVSEGLPLKLALFNFQKYVKEEDFSVEFMLKGGMRMIIRMLDVRDGGLSGNSLAASGEYWNRIIEIVITATQPNILRPATAVLRKLVISSPQAYTSGDRRVKHRKGKSKAASSVGGHASPAPIASAVEDFGFDRVFKRMAMVLEDPMEHAVGIERVMSAIVKRLEGAGDLELVSQSLGFINASLRAGYQDNAGFYPFLVTVLEHIHVRKYISRLIPTSSNNIVEPQILNFQARYAAILHQRRLKPVRPTPGSDQERLLQDIYHAGQLGRRSGSIDMSRDGQGTKRSMDGWRSLGMTWDEEGEMMGMSTEGEMFRDTGELGLECMHWFAVHDENYYNIVIEQQAKQPDRRCPIGRASAECVKVLCEHYKISQAGHHAPPHFQVFLLNFPRLHHLVLRFFLRMWTESESRLSDFPRVAFLVRSHVRSSLEHESSKNWLALEADLLDSDYRSIRDRQMEALEQEDGMLNRPAVLELREKLYGDAYEVMCEQRIGCMLAGGWFNSAMVITPGIQPSVKPNPAKPLRFLRLSPNRKTIAWADFASRNGDNPSYESLRERIDISNITDVRLQTSCAIGSRSPTLMSKLSFSLMSGGELSLMDVDAIHAAQLAEWTDGIRVLRGEVGMRSTESANYVHILTELALKVRLLDITGDGVDIPDKVAYGQAPQSAEFWFAKARAKTPGLAGGALMTLATMELQTSGTARLGVYRFPAAALVCIHPMSNSSYCTGQDNGVTSSQSPLGIGVIQVADFYQKDGILHPVAVGTIAILCCFIYLRLASNRCVAPVTLFDWILNVALGSTLAGIVNGTSLARGMISLVTLLSFQLISSQVSSHYGKGLEHMMNSPPLVIAFRGQQLSKVMRKHRISTTDLNGALRGHNIWNIKEVEAVIIEPTGQFSVYKRANMPEDYEAEVLMDVPGYKRLVEHFDLDEKKGTQESVGRERERANDIAQHEA